MMLTLFVLFIRKLVFLISFSFIFSYWEYEDQSLGLSVYIKGALWIFGEEIQTQNLNMYNIN